MNEVRKADPAARRQAVTFLILGAALGTVLILAFERYGTPLRNWLLSQPGEAGGRLRLVFLLTATVLSAPLVAFAAYVWALGVKVMRAREFPPPGYRVIRDTPVVYGQAAERRGRGLKAVALCLGVASVVLWLLFWWLAGVVS